MPYAAKTEVSPEKTRAEIETLIGRHKGTHFAYMSAPEAYVLGFMIGETRLRFTLPVPKNTTAQITRSRWRALLLVLKAKLEAVALGITSVEQEFLAHVVIDGGERTVGEAIIPRLPELRQPPPQIEGEARRRPPGLGEEGYLP